MRRVIKHLVAPFAMLVAGCAAGGGGCGGCGGLTPLPEGFKPEARIENAGSVRLTASGLDFLEQNLGTLAQSLLGGMGNGGVITFPVPSSSGSVLFIDYTLCPDGSDPNQSPPLCTAEIDLANAQLQIDPQAPHNLRIHGPLPVRLQNLPILIDYGLFDDTAIATLNGNNGCPPGEQTYANIDLDVDISIEIDTDQTHSRYGYTKVQIGAVTVNENQLSSALRLSCGDSISGDILNALKGLILPSLIDGLIGTLGDTLGEQLCQQADPNATPSCPVGTNDDGNGVCVYPDGACASILLGLDGHIDLGSLLASISPGNRSAADILFAAGGHSPRDDGSGFAWGDLNPVGGGATLGMYGGAEANPISKCVKLSEIPVPAGIAIPDELVDDALAGGGAWPAGTPGPHVGIALSERFTNYAMNSIYNSGLLCLAITSDTIPLINSGTLKLLASGLDTLGFQKESQPVAIVVRPGAPPKVTFGNGTNIETDPVLRVNLDQASFDFYIWSLDRYIRFMTVTYDLDVPVNLTVTPEGLTPVIQTIGVNNGVVTNAELLGDTSTLAQGLADLISGQVGQAIGGGISPIDLNSALASLGLSLIIPDTVEGQGSPGLRKLVKGQDNYLGIFASLGIASQMGMVVADTTAVVRSKDVDPEGLVLRTMTADNAPRVELVLGSDLDDGSRAMEYQVRVDQGVWRPFTRERILDVQDPWLRLPGRHVISVRSRVVGDPMSLDATPAEVEVVVDAAPPAIKVHPVEDGRARIEVLDDVTGAERAEVRVRLDGGAWSEWLKASEIGSIEVGDADDIEIEARDEEGNLGTAQQALIRGRGAPGDAAGCGCEVAGGTQTGTGAAGWLAAAALAGIGARLRRRRTLRERAQQRVAGGMMALGVVGIAGAQAGCNCGDDSEAPPGAQCGEGCLKLEPGLIGAYTSVAISGDKVWVAGYAEKNPMQGFEWGDLIVGTLEGEKVAWATIDGVPAEPRVDPTKFDTSGWRGGQTEAGEDVGLWTSIAIGPDGSPAVAYYDVGTKRLKFAQLVGGAWVVSVVQEKAQSDIGRYAKLTFLNGTPVIAYLAMEPGEGGATLTSVRLAWGDSATPASWSFEEVASDPASPCRALFCSTGTVCVAATQRCTAPADGCGDCATGEECVDDGTGAVSCQALFESNKLETYPDAIGDYIAIAPDGIGGLGVAFYDRIHGNVVVASKTSGAWESLVVDGQAADGTDTGDVGMGLALAIDDAGDWHLAYADGLSEGVRYLLVRGGTEIVPAEIVDDGAGIEGTPFDDGQHIVGDDASLFVAPGGDVHLSYQDATSGRLRYVVGTPSSTGHTWQVREIQQQSFAGAFSKIVQVGGQIRVANWWRTGGATIQGDVAFISP